MSYSNSNGGTLTFPSPTHIHHVDVTSAVRSLRRSLSRSPSKFRLSVTRSPSASPKSPLSPSPLSPPKRSWSQPSSNSATPSHTPSPLARPFPPSVKLSLRASNRAKTIPPRPLSRTRTSPRSPLKRALSQTSDAGNVLPTSPLEGASGQENARGNISPSERRSFEKHLKERNMQFNLELTAPINHALMRLGGDGANDMPSTTSGVSSPLKRSDAIMNLDQASLGSPVAKRRSLHGSASFGHDFNVFDHGPTSSPQFDIHDDSNQEYELSSSSLGSAPSSMASALSGNASLPRRSSSLRKSTLQQRYGDKTSWGRRHAAHELSSLSAEISTPVAAKNRPRLSLDQFMPPLQRESPFSSQGSLPSASVHVLPQPQPQAPAHQPHPLSRTMTTSSSSSSLMDESPTHVPVYFGDQPRPRLDFSKSLPAGSLRPFALGNVTKEENGSFSTPVNYKSVKPLPAAFMSTGLISKVNKFPEDPQALKGQAHMPDTPCKKPINGFATYPAPMPGSAIAKARHVRHSFGTPSTPFSPHGNSGASSIFGKGAIFGSGFGFGGLTRRGSFLGIENEDLNGSPDEKGDSQSSDQYELPPTPTKQAPPPSDRISKSGNGTPFTGYSMPNLSANGHGMRKAPRTSSKLKILFSSDDSAMEEDDSIGPKCLADSGFRLSSPSISSFGRSRALRGAILSSPAPLVPKSLASYLSPSKKRFTKSTRVVPASPLERIDFFERVSPHTPQEAMLPPDPSGLSISNKKDKDAHAFNAGAMLPPATPTSGREYFPQFGDRRTSVTPINGFIVPEVDEALTSRFEKVELIGTGEFSQVYKVTQSTIHTNAHLFFRASHTPPTPIAGRIFAVKKARQPFQGIRDRNRKLQEVNVLRALRNSDHVVQFVDSWDEKDHLYIQTEYCEEGSLDIFLSQVGRKGRLDDFRIWKILIELSQGLKYIHDSGYIHLDLKPANVLITFEGVLKIADFGMAATWPAPAGIEGEGDREYIGPEILLGKYDKPADVFALGLIMLEIAGNVQLPDNGPTWQRLRSGDMSDVPSLTWSAASTILRDATGIPVEDSDTGMEGFGIDEEALQGEFGSPTKVSRKRHSMPVTKPSSHGNIFASMRRGELHHAPEFMRDEWNDQSLDRIVKWMLSPRPDDRPMVDQILSCASIRWVEARRRAGATVYEGNWGPADDVLADDAEMIDV